MCPLETWGFKNRDTTSEKVACKYAEFIHWIPLLVQFEHIWRNAVSLTSILPWIGFGINKWEENCALTPPWKEIWSQSVWICIFLVSWSSFFSSTSSFILRGNGVNKTFLQERHLWTLLKHSVLHHILVGCFLGDRIGISSIYLHRICDFGVKTKHKLNILRHSEALCVAHVKSVLARCWSWIDVLFMLCMMPALLPNVDLSWFQQTIKH